MGAAKIRVRSLLAAAADKRGETAERVAYNLTRVPFTKKMRKTHTLLSPQMSPLHFELLQAAFVSAGYNLVVMPPLDRAAVDIGLKYVNNDACYPAAIVVGQLMNALGSGLYDTGGVSLFMSQTGGGCRASNYIGFIRKALRKADLAHIPVISLSAQGIEKNPGFKFTPKLLNGALQALVYGDLLMRALYATRPYEKTPGSADALREKWLKIFAENVKNGGPGRFKSGIYACVADFCALPLTGEKKPRVGVVGEILVKYHPTANNDLVTLLENEGCEAVVPDLTDFFIFLLHNSTYKYKYFGFKRRGKIMADFCIKVVEAYRRDLKKALTQCGRFGAPASIEHLAKLAKPIVSMGNQTGEGWFLTGEIMELIESGVSNIVCAQPFACLPNHVTGKGIIREVKRRHPKSNITPVDYDAGASEVNQVNRIKLMIETAKRNMEGE